MTVTPKDLGKIVRIPDGRTGRLFFVPEPGSKVTCDVMMTSGMVLSFAPNELQVVR